MTFLSIIVVTLSSLILFWILNLLIKFLLFIWEIDLKCKIICKKKINGLNEKKKICTSTWNNVWNIINKKKVYIIRNKKLSLVKWRY